MDNTQHNQKAAPSVVTSNKLSVPHGMYSRCGGSSREPYDSLNISYSVGDSPERVRANRQLLTSSLGLDCIVSVHQVHGDRVLQVERKHAGHEQEGFDAMMTNLPGIGLLIQQADCQAVLLHDHDRQVIAAIHSGWRGSVANIIARTIDTMGQTYGTLPSSLAAAISPSLGPCCAEFRHFRQELPKHFHSFQPTPAYFNFWEISRMQLTGAGVPDAQIDITGICTCCDRKYFSYRRAKRVLEGKTGRNGSVIALPST